MYQPLLYSQTNKIAKLETENFLKKFASSTKFAKSCKVLDVGCGDGTVTKILQSFLPEDFGELVGLDVSQKMVEFANLQNFDERVKFCIADVTAEEDFRGLRGKFDYVFTFFCLNWIQEQSAAWKNLYDSLKPGGQVFAIVLSDSAIYRVYEVQSTNPKWAPYMERVADYITPYLHSENPEKLAENLMKAAGFTVEVCTALDQKYVYPDEESLKRSINAVNAFTPKIPPEILEEYLQDFLAKLKDLEYLKAKVTSEESSKAMVYQILHLVGTKSK